jgi:uncharacterized membrane protein
MKRLNQQWLLFLLAGWLIAGTWMAAAAATNAPSSTAPGASAIVHKDFRWGPFLAPFHAVVLHYPIGFLTLALILEVYGLHRPSDELRRITRLVILLSLLSGLLAATFGILRARDGGYETRGLELHRLFGMAVPVFMLMAWFGHRLAFRPKASRGWLHAYRGVLLLTMALLVVAGHHGGNLTHGSRYLVENAPEFVRDMLDEESPADTSSPESAVKGEAGQSQFASVIQPILKAKCINCHGPEKHKGGYRLDKADLALTGGDSGKTAIKPGEPMQSNLLRMVLLPSDHDEAMPPEGKEPLTAEEIVTLAHWIQQGAAFEEVATVK